MIYFLLVLLLSVSLAVFNPAISLILGIVFTVLNKNSVIVLPSILGSRFLKMGIVLLGGTISYSSFTSISANYFPLISLYVFLVMIIGFFLGYCMKINKKHLLLLVVGTAICGGTAVAALAPIIESKKEDLASSIAIIFLLNLIAIIVFPFIGTALDLTQQQFGVFAALTIHDIASVVGAASIYGESSLEVATILKLGRTLWIVPLVLFSSWYFSRQESGTSIPYFILLFALFILLGSVVSFSDSAIFYLKTLSKICLLMGLFFIGTGISLKSLREVSLRPASFAICLWLIAIGMTSLLYFL